MIDRRGAPSAAACVLRSHPKPSWIHLGLRLGLAAVLPAVGMGECAAQTTQRLSVLRNGEVVGSITAASADNRTTVEYTVSNNGRGPKLVEEIVLDGREMPTSWSIKSLPGSSTDVDELYTRQANRVRWRSQADAGARKVDGDTLYTTNDNTPWDLGVYARALLAAGKSEGDVLPTGRIKLSLLKPWAAMADGKQVAASLYRIDGLRLQPDYILLDQDRNLFAVLGETSVVRAGFEALSPRLQDLLVELEGERLRTLGKRLTHRPDSPVRIRNVHVFDPAAGKSGPLSTVVVSGDRITAILPGDAGVDPEEFSVDGEGGTLFPGLTDMHAHVEMDSGLFRIAAGVTSVRDMGNDNTLMRSLLRFAANDELLSTRIVPNGLIEGRSPYSARFGFVADSADAALKAVRWYSDRGYRQIKLYNSIKPEWVAPIAAEAHARGMTVTGHIPAFMTADQAIEAGYDAVTHINQIMLQWVLKPSDDPRTMLRVTAMGEAGKLDLDSDPIQRTLALAKSHHIAMDPTMVTVEKLLTSRAGRIPHDAAAYIDHLPVQTQRAKKRNIVRMANDAEAERYAAGVDKLLQLTKRLHDAGVQLLPGTDEEIGFSLHRELELYVKSGIPAAEVMRLATLDSAKYLGRDGDLGTIEKGKLADLVLVAGDPSKDILAVRAPRMVMKGGNIYFPSEIYDAVGITPFAKAPALVRPERGSEGAGAPSEPRT